MACSCQGSAGGDLYEARTSQGTVVEVAPGRYQGTREEAMAAAQQTPGAFLAKAKAAA